MIRENSFKESLFECRLENIQVYSNKEKPLWEDPAVHLTDIT